MKPNHPFLLTLNGGSSSIRFALYRKDGTLTRGLSGKLDRIGMPGMGLTVRDPLVGVEESLPLTLEEGVAPEEWLLSWLEARPEFALIEAVGHRVVHGMERNAENAPVISRSGGRVMVRVIRTDEQLMIARAVSRLMDGLV